MLSITNNKYFLSLHSVSKNFSVCLHKQLLVEGNHEEFTYLLKSLIIADSHGLIRCDLCEVFLTILEPETRKKGEAWLKQKVLEILLR